MTASNSPFVLLPELLAENLDSAFCITAQGKISRRELLTQALSLSKKLPEKDFAVNLCQDRYLFIVAFLAVLLRGQISLLPPNQSSRTIQGLLSAYPQSYCLVDGDVDNPQACFAVSTDAGFENPETFPLIDVDRIVSISFTSGSTGEPKPVAKTWREFQRAAELALAQFELAGETLTLISTAVPQHMYGLETSFFWPLFSRLALYDSRPFYPEDVRRSLQAAAGSCVLVATPTHLKACVQSEVNWPIIAKILSSTAPMPYALAVAIENKLQAPLYELFGSTETLSFASRRTVISEQWRPYQGMRLQEEDGKFAVQGGHLRQPVALDDTFLIDAQHCFKVLGRSADLIKIAGKRASLTELNRLLNAIEGIDDGVFFECRAERLAVLVVSELSKKTIVAELKQAVDAVFLPRNVFRVAKLPRNGMGKIIKAELDQLIRGLHIV